MRSMPSEAARLKAYGFALVAAGIAFVASYVSWPFLKSTPWAFFFAAIIASAWYGGQGPSLLATAILVVLGRYFFVYPYQTFTVDGANAVPILIFIGVSLFIGYLASARRRAEAYERSERRRFQTTVMSLGDAVIATDAAGNVTLMNGIAEKLTGWTTDLAAGKRLEEVFVIINEVTRERTPSPFKKVLETGRIEGLANHTLLIARDGAERPIEDSASPIKNERGDISGVVLVFRDVTEKRKAVKALAESEERYRTLFTSMDEGFCVIEILFDEAGKPADYRFLEINPAFEMHTGLREATGKTVLEVVPDHETLWIEAYGQVALTGKSAQLVQEVKALDRWFEVSAFRYGDAEAHKVAVLFTNVTSRVKAEHDRERLLREVLTERARLADVIQRSPSFMTILKGPDLVFELVNERYRQLIGRREVVGMKLRDALPEVAGQGYFEMLDQVYRGGEPVVGRDSRVTLAGLPGEPMRERFVDFVFQPIRDPDGAVSGVLVHGVDLTERKLAEREARAKDERINLLIENVKDYAVVIADSEGTVIEWQGGAERITGYSSAEAVGRPPHFLFTSEDRAAGAPEKELEKAAASGRAEDKRWHLKKDQTRFYADGVMTALYDDAGKLRGFGKVFKDATGERQAEEAKARRAFQLQTLAEIATRVNSAHDVNSVLGVVTGEARRLLGAHQAATTMAINPSHPQPINVASNSDKYPRGSNAPDIEGLGFYEVFGSNNESIRLTRGDLDADPRWRASGDVRRYVEAVNGWLAAPLVGRNGKSMGLIQLSDKDEGEFTPDDEAILVQLAQLAAIAIENARLYEDLRGNDERKDEFLAMLAHELRNPLAAIGNAVFLSSKTDAREQHDWSNEVITRQMRHLSRLIDDLMDVSRITRGKIALRREVVEATPILKSAAATVMTLVEERKHTLDLEVDQGKLWVNVDPTRLEQVVVNLLNNAAKYSENGGRILLSARQEGDEVVIGVKDNGVGIPPEKLPEMFELFAQGDRSLARSEGGLGIGLTVVKKLVEMHGGSITASSEGLGHGSEFLFRLPSPEAPPVGPTMKSDDPTDETRKKARILIVDDNEDTANGMARLMKLIGHEVATAHDGYEAIAAAREFKPEFVMLDIGLPGMSGYEVATKLRQDACCQDAVIVAVSGYGQDEDRRRSREAGFDHHLIKPVDHGALLALFSDRQT